MEKHVESYFIKKYPNGIYLLIFNLKDRWGYYCRISNTECGFRNDTSEDWDIQKITKFLPDTIHYLPTVLQEKDQLMYYFIPFENITEGELIFETKL